MKRQTLTQIYFPVHCFSKSGYIVGWAIRGFACCITGIYNCALSELEESLLKMNEGLQVLGIFDVEEQSAECVEKRNTADLWYSLEKASTVPTLVDIHCCGYRYTPKVHFIMYDILEKTLSPFSRGVHTRDKKLRNSDLSTLQITLDYINRANFISNRLDFFLFDKVPARSQLSLIPSIFFLVSLFKGLAGWLLWVFSYKIPYFNRGISDFPISIKMHEQLLVRNSQFELWERTRNTMKPKYDAPYLTQGYWDDFIRSRSVFMTVTIDFLIGLALFYIFTEYNEEVIDIIHWFGSSLHIENLKTKLDYITNKPQGFKPNEELEDILLNVVKEIIEKWEQTITTNLTMIEPKIISFIGLFGVFGLTFQISLVQDILRFCTLHIKLIYLLLKKILYLGIKMVSLLTRIMQGKRTFILVRMIETDEIRGIHVIFCAVLFVTIIFLLPTIAVFYILFFVYWMFLQTIYLAFAILIVFANHFPAAECLFYFLEPQMYVDSVFVEFPQSMNKSTPNASYFFLKTQKVPFGNIGRPFVKRLVTVFRF